MGMTITEKILANAAGKSEVKMGEFVWVKVNTLMIHDPCAPGVISYFYEQFGKDAKVWSNEDLVVIPDHFIYTTDQKTNRNIDLMREFSTHQKIKYFYDPGTEKYQGVCHITLSQEGHIRPGDVLIGTDSHTVTGGAFGAFATGVGNTDASFVAGTGEILLKIPASILITFKGEMPNYLSGKDLILTVLKELTMQGATYKSIEFDGDAIDKLPIEERMTICNMGIEAGAKNAIMKPNEITLNYLKDKAKAPYKIFESDPDAEYEKKYVYDVSRLEPMVAKPHSPDNCVPAKELSAQNITRGYIGSCTGGKTSDLVEAAKILNGRRVVVDTYAVPATRKVLEDIITLTINSKSIYHILSEAGVKVSFEPSCAACCGGPPDTFGRLNSKEICISTTNRNFQGRMGNMASEIYLASPQTVAASAVTGRITDPRNL